MAASLLKEAFGDSNLYQLLGVSNDATPAQVKKGYHKAALKWHPDKNRGSADATLKFQALGEAHRILSDPELRAEYDSTGLLPDSSELQTTDWRQYFSKLFKRVRKDDIDDFAKTYVGSEEEKADVLRAYTEGGGDLGYVVDHVMLAKEKDAERFEDLVRAAISSGEVEALPGLETSAKGSGQAKKRQRKARKEAKEADQTQTEMESRSSLAAAIQARQASAGSFLADLEARYSNATPRNMKRPARCGKRNSGC